jgi:PPK2 family polyphosphate:nucleotide phosphotransferase
LRSTPDETGNFPDKERAEGELVRNRRKLVRLQDALYAGTKHALLVVLQAMDTGGKDGTIKHIFYGVNPQGCTVSAFKVPTQEELKHDFLWRIHQRTPALGMIGIFNRSHYEDVLVVRVHQQLSKKQLRERFRAINEFEKTLVENGTTILKFYLHISKEEQLQRLHGRLEDPRRMWKFTERDFQERRCWPDYQKAYEDVFKHCSTHYAPWYIIPANKKWFRNVTVSQIIVHSLERLKLKYPEPLMLNFPDFT